MKLEKVSMTAQIRYINDFDTDTGKRLASRGYWNRCWSSKRSEDDYKLEHKIIKG